MPRNNAKPKCTCNMGYMVVAWVLFAVALWVLVGTFATQFTSAAPMQVSGLVLGWYFVGIVLGGIGKMLKWKSCGACAAHK